MESNIKKLPHSEVELTCTVSQDEFVPFITGAVSALGKDMTVPGFRKGKAPAALVQERVGNATLYEEAARAAISHFYAQCANEHGVEPLGTPVVTIRTLPPEHPFAFTVRVAVLPSLELPDYRALLTTLGAERRHAAVTDQMVIDSLGWLQKSRATTVARSGASQDNDQVVIDLSMTHGGAPVAHGAQEDFVVHLGRRQVFPGLEQRLTGVEKGARLAFDLDIPHDYWNKEIAGKTIHFAVVVKDVRQEVLPELNDAFAQSLGKFKTLEELRQSIREGLALEEREKEQQRFRMLLLKHVSSHTPCDPPEVLITAELDASIANIRSAIEATGIAWETYLKQIDKAEGALRKELLPQVEERVRIALLIDAIADKEHIAVSDEEVETEAQKYLAQYRSVTDAQKEVSPAALTARARDILKNEKVSAFLENLVPAQEAK